MRHGKTVAGYCTQAWQPVIGSGHGSGGGDTMQAAQPAMARDAVDMRDADENGYAAVRQGAQGAAYLALGGRLDATNGRLSMACLMGTITSLPLQLTCGVGLLDAARPQRSLYST